MSDPAGALGNRTDLPTAFICSHLVLLRSHGTVPQSPMMYYPADSWYVKASVCRSFPEYLTLSCGFCESLHDSGASEIHLVLNGWRMPGLPTTHSNLRVSPVKLISSLCSILECSTCIVSLCDTDIH